MQNFSNRQSGFTLIEVVLYVGVTGGILLVVTLLFAQINESRVQNRTMLEVNRQGAHVIQQVEQSIHNADSVVIPSAGVSAERLELDGGQQAEEFRLDNGQLVRADGNGATVSLTNNRVRVTSLTFENFARRNTPDVIRVRLELRHVSPRNQQARAYSQTFVTGVSLRSQ